MVSLFSQYSGLRALRNLTIKKPAERFSQKSKKPRRAAGRGPEKRPDTSVNGSPSSNFLFACGAQGGLCGVWCVCSEKPNLLPSWPVLQCYSPRELFTPEGVKGDKMYKARHTDDEHRDLVNGYN